MAVEAFKSSEWCYQGFFVFLFVAWYKSYWMRLPCQWKFWAQSTVLLNYCYQSFPQIDSHSQCLSLIQDMEQQAHYLNNGVPTMCDSHVKNVSWEVFSCVCSEDAVCQYPVPWFCSLHFWRAVGVDAFEALMSITLRIVVVLIMWNYDVKSTIRATYLCWGSHLYHDQFIVESASVPSQSYPGNEWKSKFIQRFDCNRD